MIVLTPENFREHARDNLSRSPIFEGEFNEALKLPLAINKNITKQRNGSRGGNLRMMINDSVTFLNQFDRPFGFQLLLYLVGVNNESGVKSIGQLLGHHNGDCDEVLYDQLLVEMRG